MKHTCVLLYPDDYNVEPHSLVKEELFKLAEELGFDVWDWNLPEATHQPSIIQIQDKLIDAKRVIAILHSPTGVLNPNIMYEVGFVHGIGRLRNEAGPRMILVTRSDLVEHLPFNIKLTQVALFPSDLQNHEKADWTKFSDLVARWMQPSQLEDVALIRDRCLNSMNRLKAKEGTEFVEKMEQIARNYFSGLETAARKAPDGNYTNLANIFSELVDEMANDFSVFESAFKTLANQAKEKIVDRMVRLREWYPLDEPSEKGMARFTEHRSIKAEFVRWSDQVKNYDDGDIYASVKEFMIDFFGRIPVSDEPNESDWTEIVAHVCKACVAICSDAEHGGISQLTPDDCQRSLEQWFRSIRNYVVHNRQSPKVVLEGVKSITKTTEILQTYATAKAKIMGNRFLLDTARRKLNQIVDTAIERVVESWWSNNVGATSRTNRTNGAAGQTG